jgi:hypothetical protein
VWQLFCVCSRLLLGSCLQKQTESPFGKLLYLRLALVSFLYHLGLCFSLQDVRLQCPV